MKKSLRNFVLACTATAAVSLALATSAFAEAIPDGSLEYNLEAGTITVTESFLGTLSGQTTILIYDKDVPDPANLTADQILYINQDDAGTVTTFTGMGLKGGLVADKTYVIKIGGENLQNGVYVGELSIDESGEVTYKWGDVNADDTINADDVTRLLRHTVGVELLTYEQDELIGRCDVTLDGQVNADDVTRLLRHTVGVELLPESN